MSENEEGQEKKKGGGIKRLFGLVAIIGAIFAVLTFLKRRGGDDEDFDDDDEI